MRGHCDESEEVKAARALRYAARYYAADCLNPMFGPKSDEVDRGLMAAAVAYAATLPKPRKPRKPRKAKA